MLLLATLQYLGVEKVTYIWLQKSRCVARSERVNGWRLNPNITQALIPPIGLVLTWLDLFYSMWFLLGQMNGYGWPIYIAVKTSANLTNWDGLSLLYYHLVLLTLEHSGSSSWGIWNQKKIIIRTHLFIKALVVKNSVLHNFGFGKVSPAKQL